MDIVERLRDEANMHDADDVDLHLEAVDEIEYLRRKNAELEQINWEHAELLNALYQWDALKEYQYTGSEQAMFSFDLAAKHTTRVLYGPAPFGLNLTKNEGE